MLTYRVVSDRYFETLGADLVEGRAFSTADRPDGAAVTVVNEAAAARYWPGGRPGRPAAPTAVPARRGPRGSPRAGPDWFTGGGGRARLPRTPGRGAGRSGHLSLAAPEPVPPDEPHREHAGGRRPVSRTPSRARSGPWTATSASTTSRRWTPSSRTSWPCRGSTRCSCGCSPPSPCRCRPSASTASRRTSSRGGRASSRSASRSGRSRRRSSARWRSRPRGSGAAGVLVGLAGSLLLARAMASVLHEVAATDALVLAGASRRGPRGGPRRLLAPGADGDAGRSDARPAGRVRGWTACRRVERASAAPADSKWSGDGFLHGEGGSE